MPSSFFAAIRAETAKRCIGRSTEKRRLLDLYRTQGPKIVVVVGVAGIGKTTLATWLASRVSTEARVAWVSGEHVAPNPEAFLAGLEHDTSTEQLGRGPARDVLVVDAFEKLEPLAPWFFGSFLCTLGSELLVILVSREHFRVADRVRFGLGDAVEELELGPLDTADCDAVLDSLQVPAADRRSICELAAGHPLALRLAVAPGARASGRDPSVMLMDELVRGFVAQAPSQLHRDALYVAAVARVTDEALLGATTSAVAEVPTIMDWLRRSTLVERAERGLSLHDSVRTALFRDLQRNEPDRLLRVQRQIIDVMVRRMVAQDITSAHDTYVQALYAQRNRSQVAHFQVFGPERYSVVELHDGLLPEVREHVERFEGAESLRAFDAWRDRGAVGFAVVDGSGAVAAFEVIAIVPRDSDPEALGDPLIRRSWELWRERSPSPNEGELHCFRWFMQIESYQEITGPMGHLFTVGPLVMLPRAPSALHMGFITSPPERWRPLAPSFLIEGSDAELRFADRRYGFFFASLARQLDRVWSLPNLAFEGLRAYLYHQFGFPYEPSTERPAADLLLSLETVTRELPALLAALQTADDPQLNPLGSALIRRGAPASRTALSAWLLDALSSLTAAPRTQHLATVVRATYLADNTKQLAAAAQLGLPFGTYRYQLRKGLEALARVVWDRTRG